MSKANHSALLRELDAMLPRSWALEDLGYVAETGYGHVMLGPNPHDAKTIIWVVLSEHIMPLLKRWIAAPASEQTADTFRRWVDEMKDAK